MSGVSLGVSSLPGSAWKDLGGADGCTDWCAVDMGCRSGQMWQSLGFWARVSGKVEDGVGGFKSCCYSGILIWALGPMMSRRSYV